MNRSRFAAAAILLMALTMATPALAGSFDCVKLDFLSSSIKDHVLYFGKVPVGQTASQTVTVKNPDLHFSDDISDFAAMPDPPFAVDSAASTCMKGEFGPLATCKVVVTCTPQAEKKIKGKLTFSFSIKRCENQSLGLHCNGVAPSNTPTPTATATPTNTASSTATATSTTSGSATPTATASSSSTRTPTPTATATITATRTSTPSPSATGATRTATATPTSAGSPTVTATATATSTPAVSLNSPVQLGSDGGSVQVAVIPLNYVGVAFAGFASGATNETILYSASTDGGSTFSSPLPLWNSSHILGTPLIVPLGVDLGGIAYYDATASETYFSLFTVGLWTPGSAELMQISAPSPISPPATPAPTVATTPTPTATPTPVEITNGTPQALAVDSGGNLYLAVQGGAGNPGGVSFWKSPDGATWSQLTAAPVNTSDITGGADVAAGAGGVAFAWYDVDSMTSITDRLASFSTDGGKTFTMPTTLHSFPSTEQGFYFDPTLFFFGDVFIDFATEIAFPGLQSDVFYDSFTISSGDIVAAPDQPIGTGSGLQGGFGVLINSTVVAVAIDTSNSYTLHVFYGPLGATLTDMPLGAITGVQEARIFPLGGNKFIIDYVQASEPGPITFITGQVN